MSRMTMLSRIFLKMIDMNNLKVIIIFLCISLFLPFAINAQDSSGDSTVYKMSKEKADSLLVALSKSKSKNLEFVNESASTKSTYLTNNTNSDTIIGISVSSEIQDTVLPIENFNISDTTVVITEAKDTYFTSTDTVSLNINSTEEAKKNRKKADVDRNDLLVEQTGSKVILKNEEDVDFIDIRSINEGTLIGAGGYRMKDEYLSDVGRYGGVGFRFMNERMRLLKTTGSRVSRQNIVNVDVSSTLNGAENANFLSAFADYSIGYHYRLLPHPYFKVLIGGSARGMLGMVYSTRNGNNPMTLHADLDLNISLIAIYEFRIKKHLIAIRYQAETPFAGVLFSPVYDQSYYEIFSLGNTAEIFNLNSFNNKFALRNYLTLDFPVGGLTARIGYFGHYYNTTVHSIDRYIISHNFMLGFVKEYIAFGGKEMRRRNLFNSAYY